MDVRGLIRSTCGCLYEENTTYSTHDDTTLGADAFGSDLSPVTVVHLCIDHERQARRRTAIAVLQRAIDIEDARRQMAQRRDSWRNTVDVLNTGASIVPMMDGDERIGYRRETL